MNQKPATYRVWVNQVNQVMVEVRARTEEEAAEKGYAKWRREQAHSTVGYVERVTPVGQPEDAGK